MSERLSGVESKSPAVWIFRHAAGVFGLPSKDSDGRYTIIRGKHSGGTTFYLKPVDVCGGRRVPVGTIGTLVETYYVWKGETVIKFND